MKMEFETSEPVKYDLTEAHEVKLTLEKSITCDGVVYLRANGIAIMGFLDGEYCLYSSEHDAVLVKGLKFVDGKIKQSTHIF